MSLSINGMHTFIVHIILLGCVLHVMDQTLPLYNACLWLEPMPRVGYLAHRTKRFESSWWR